MFLKSIKCFLSNPFLLQTFCWGSFFLLYFINYKIPCVRGVLALGVFYIANITLCFLRLLSS